MNTKNISIQVWVSKHGYFYKIDSVSNRTKRISEAEYMMYYEEKYDL